MILSIDLAPDVARALEAECKERGIALEALLRELAEREAARLDTKNTLGSRVADADAAVELLNELDELTQQFATAAPPLDEDAVARVYEERETAQL